MEEIVENLEDAEIIGAENTENFNLNEFKETIEEIELKKDQKITLDLILKRNLSNNKELRKESTKSNETVQEESEPADEIELQAEKLLKLTHIHLDRERIGEIDNLAEYLGDVTHLYLQQNLIRRIENLEFLKSLQFLILSHNLIEKVENLLSLRKLKLLDLSSNRIEDLDVKQLPPSLVFLDLSDNEFFKNNKWQACNYESQLKQHLKNLRQLNGQEAYRNALSEPQLTERTESRIDSLFNVDTLESIKDRILDRSKQRQRKDIQDLDKLWQQRKVKLDLSLSSSSPTSSILFRSNSNFSNRSEK
jgi:hypothetical protein